jgi:S1-C subfamily serine protease
MVGHSENMHTSLRNIWTRLALAGIVGAALVVAAVPAAGASSTSAVTRAEKGLVDVNVDLPYEEATGSGTGMVLTSSGEIVTNNHVIEGATTVSVVDVANHRTYQATVVGYDTTADVAVLQLVGASGLHRVSLGTSTGVKSGESVFAIGNAGGAGGTPTVSSGKVTAAGQSITASDELGGSEKLSGLLETNAALQPGDSGGSLVSAKGKVIGMDTAGSSGFSLGGSSSAGYAIPISKVLRIARDIEAGDASAEVHIGGTPFLGVSVVEGTFYIGGTLETGLEVVQVIPGSGSAQAGIVSGDVITSFDGTTITASTDLTSLILSLPVGATVPVSWIDAAGATQTSSVTLGSGPPQ